MSSFCPYDSDGGYDPMEHMINDPLGFQIYGYGGFGYDTSHVPADDKAPEIVVAAEDGWMDTVKGLVEAAANKNHRKSKTNDEIPEDFTKRSVLNASRRWTEVDYRMSGFTKEYEWHDLTVLATAANQGHVEIVEYLLREGSDPTLEGCHTDNVHWTALQAAQAGETSFVTTIMNNSNTVSQIERCIHTQIAGKSPIEISTLIYKRRNDFSRCLALLKEAERFWSRTNYSSSRYSEERVKKGFPNNPTDQNGLLSALEAVSQEQKKVHNHETLTANLAVRIQKVIEKEEEAMRASIITDKIKVQETKRSGQTDQGQGRSRKRQKLQTKCKFFAQGKCRFGDNCRFSHDEN